MHPERYLVVQFEVNSGGVKTDPGIVSTGTSSADGYKVTAESPNTAGANGLADWDQNQSKGEGGTLPHKRTTTKTPAVTVNPPIRRKTSFTKVLSCCRNVRSVAAVLPGRKK